MSKTINLKQITPVVSVVGNLIEDIPKPVYVDYVKLGKYKTPAIGIYNGKKVAIVSNRYKLITNKLLLDTFENTLKNYYTGEIEKEIKTNGMGMVARYLLKDMEFEFGKEVWEEEKDLQLYNIENGKLIQRGSLNDKLKPIITVYNSYDGTYPIAVGFSFYRVVCRNILFSNLKTTRLIYARHTGKANIYDLTIRLDIMFSIMKNIVEKMKEFVKIKVPATILMQIATELDREEHFKVWFNEYRELDITIPNLEISLWRLINEITYLTTHTPKAKINKRVRYVLSKTLVDKATRELYKVIEQYTGQDIFTELLNAELEKLVKSEQTIEDISETPVAVI